MKNKIFIFLAVFIFLFSLFLITAIDWSDDLLAYYSFNGTTGVVLDSAPGNLYNGTVSDAVDRGFTGIISNSFDFNQTVGSAVIISGFPSAPLEGFSVVLWLNASIDEGDGQPRMIDRWEAAPTQFRIMSETRLTRFTVAATGTATATASHEHLNETWVMITGVYNGTDIGLWFNDTLVGRAALTGDMGVSTKDIYIGADNLGGQMLNGTIDEVSLWNRSLTQEDITELYNSGLALAFNTGGPAEASISVSLINPEEGSTTINTSIAFNATLTPVESNLTNATINVWFSNGTLVNETVNTVVGVSVLNSTIFNITLTPDNYIWSVLGCAENTTLTVCSRSANSSFEIQSFLIPTQTFNGTAFDTDLETFIVNVNTTTGTSLFSATLLYGTNNSKSFPADSIIDVGEGLFTATRLIDVPETVSNVTQNFQWRFTFDTGGGFSTEFSDNLTQNVSSTNFTMSGTEIAVNYTFFDEDTLEILRANFDGTFEWYLGSGGVTKNNSFSRPGESSFNFFTAPTTNKSFVTDVIIAATNASPLGIINSTHFDRLFDFTFERFNDTVTNRSLLLLNSTRGRSIIIEVKDTGLAPLESYLVQIERFYPGENVYRVVESRITDLFGKFVARLIENDVKYRFSFFNAEGDLVKSTSDITIACRTSICIIPFVIEDTVEDFGRFQQIPGLETTFVFNNNTNIFKFTWNDNTGIASTKRLFVERILFNGTSVVCNQTSTSDLNSLNCDVGASKASYRGQIFRLVDGRETRFGGTCSSTISSNCGVLNVKVGSLAASVFGLEGMIWGFFLLFTLIIIGIFSPAVGITLYMIGFIGLGVADIVYINPAIMIAQLVLGILFLWAFRG